MPLPGVKVLLLGPTGTGKTHSTRTLVDAGITPHYLFLEPGQDVVADLPQGSYHTHYQPPAIGGLSALAKVVKQVTAYDYKNVTRMQDTTKYPQFHQTLEALNSYTCDICSENFGDFMSWGTDRALIIDGLSGLSRMAKAMMVGNKPTMAEGEYGVAMGVIRQVIEEVVTGSKCHVVLIAHVDREPDEVSGSDKLMVKTLGKKLAPEIPLFFTDVIMAKHTPDGYSWSTVEYNCDLVGRNIEQGAKLPPTFVPLIKNWRKKAEAMQSAGET